MDTKVLQVQFACAADASNSGSDWRSCFASTPTIQVRLYKAAVTGQEQLVFEGEVALPPQWSSAGPQDVTVDLFEVSQGSGHQQRPHSHGSAASVSAGKVELQVLAINEPGSPTASSSGSFLSSLQTSCCISQCVQNIPIP